MKTEKRNLKKWVIGVAVALGPLLVLSVLCICEAFRYPRIVRSGYLRHPSLLIQATFGRLFPGDGVAKADVLQEARKIRPGEDLQAFLAYLSDGPSNDKSIRDRMFGVMWQRVADTDKTLFWVVSPVDSSRGDHDWLVYEYETGRLVAYHERDN